MQYNRSYTKQVKHSSKLLSAKRSKTLGHALQYILVTHNETRQLSYKYVLLGKIESNNFTGVADRATDMYRFICAKLIFEPSR
jgi:hypothetical protein